MIIKKTGIAVGLLKVHAKRRLILLSFSQLFFGSVQELLRCRTNIDLVEVIAGFGDAHSVLAGQTNAVSCQGRKAVDVGNDFCCLGIGSRVAASCLQLDLVSNLQLGKDF